MGPIKLTPLSQRRKPKPTPKKSTWKSEKKKTQCADKIIEQFRKHEFRQSTDTFSCPIQKWGKAPSVWGCQEWGMWPGENRYDIKECCIRDSVVVAPKTSASVIDEANFDTHKASKVMPNHLAVIRKWPVAYLAINSGTSTPKTCDKFFRRLVGHWQAAKKRKYNLFFLMNELIRYVYCESLNEFSGKGGKIAYAQRELIGSAQHGVYVICALKKFQRVCTFKFIHLFVVNQKLRIDKKWRLHLCVVNH